MKISASLTLALAASTLLGAAAHATNYSLWINGRDGDGQPGNHADFSYWGPASADAGVNKKSVNWDGYSHIADQNYRVRDALDCYCTGDNWCYVAVHSAGNLMIGYALSLYGGSTRVKKNASPDANGSCSATDGSTQVGWNIKWVDVSAGAGGGSELANSGDWALDEPLVSDLKTGTARAMYNHNETRGKLFNLYAGASGTLYSFVLPGQDDEVVSYHSSGGVSGNSGAAFCNPSDWFCNDLTLGTKKNEGGRAKWSNHSVVFRDNSERYDHYTDQNWGGVTSLVRADMALNAVAAQGSPRLPLTEAQRPAAAERLARMRQLRDAYQAATRYPPGSRPLAEQPDQLNPQRPIVEELPLRLPGTAVVPGYRLRTTQQRVYSQGDESVLLTVSARDEQGRVLPLRVVQADAHEGATGHRPPRGPQVPVSFTDDGSGGDAVAGDGVFSTLLQPARQGFAALDGLVRVELSLQSGEQPGFAFFDVIHSPQAPAAWLPGVREAVESGSLNLYLKLDVHQAGRYVASGRVFDADGRPLALLGFNETLAAGPQELRLQVFGKLVHDLQPRFPLTLRDVDAYLLKPDRFPDRALLPARHGAVHRSQAWPLSAFSTAEWRSEERSRTLAEHAKDVAEAQAALGQPAGTSAER
ncbi:MAG TPA: choice-of-anchor X domain-containing protein [Ideonella sp.]|nr:choice-of-anchor X domain-containing protein [Ideonella sp.]